MYDCGKKLASWTSLLIFATLLTACGGKDDDKTIAGEDATNIIPNTSAVASSATQTTPQSSSTAKATSSAAAIQEKDSTPPSPTQLSLQQLSESSITLIWDDATDNTGVNGYIIERNGQLIATLNYPTHQFIDRNLKAATAYTYTIKAVDYSGNNSIVSAPFTVRTLALSSSQSSIDTIVSPPANTGSANTSSIKMSSTAASSVNTTSKATSSATSSAASSIYTSSSAQSSKPLASSAVSTMSSSSKATSSISSNSSSKAQSSSTPAKTDNGASQQNKVTVTWAHPSQRENGLFLELDEIGGYELRYRKSTDSAFTYITINDNTTVEYTLEATADLDVEIAVFDTNGVYSRFVKVNQ